MADPGFPRGGASTLGGGGGGRWQHTILPNIHKTMHEIERIWDPPMKKYTFSTILEFFFFSPSDSTLSILNSNESGKSEIGRTLYFTP